MRPSSVLQHFAKLLSKGIAREFHSGADVICDQPAQRVLASSYGRLFCSQLTNRSPGSGAENPRLERIQRQT
jgi:hypothetical protein